MSSALHLIRCRPPSTRPAASSPLHLTATVPQPADQGRHPDRVAQPQHEYRDDAPMRRHDAGFALQRPRLAATAPRAAIARARLQRHRRGAAWRLRLIQLACMLLLLACVAPAMAQDPESDAPAPPAEAYRSIDALRRGAPLDTEPEAAPMARVENADLRRARGWPEQPPTIPHSIDGYQVDRNSNRCLLCHGRGGTERFQAPMVSVTHFMDRDGQVLAQISARRYFCTQCHVVQTDAQPLVGNDFIDVDTLLAAPEAR